MDLSGYVEGLRRRAAKRERAAAARAERIVERLPAVVRVLVSEYGASRVLLFGSMARGEATERSDVDLLVDGIDPARLFDAAATASRILREAEADLVPWTRARPEVRDRALSEGRVLHGGG